LSLCLYTIQMKWNAYNPIVHKKTQAHLRPTDIKNCYAWFLILSIRWAAFMISDSSTSYFTENAAWVALTFLKRNSPLVAIASWIIVMLNLAISAPVFLLIVIALEELVVVQFCCELCGSKII
jgi:hypothetical protein